MTIVRSLGVSTLVALMSAHREVAERHEPASGPLDPATIEIIEASLRNPGHVRICADLPLASWPDNPSYWTNI